MSNKSNESIKTLSCGCIYYKISSDSSPGCPEYINIERNINCLAPTHGIYP